MRSGSLKRGGKDRTVPVREDLEAWLLSYLEAAGIVGARGSRPRPTGWALSAVSVRDQLKRRLRGAGLPQRLRPHSFRVLVVTDLLAQRVPLEDVQYLVGHSNPRTTQVYGETGVYAWTWFVTGVFS